MYHFECLAYLLPNAMIKSSIELSGNCLLALSPIEDKLKIGNVLERSSSVWISIGGQYRLLSLLILRVVYNFGVG